MRSHVVGSTVSSITSVRTRLASLRPITSLRSEQLVDGVWHPLSMIDAWDIPADQSSSHDLIRAKNGDGGKVLEISVAPDPTAT